MKKTEACKKNKEVKVPTLSLRARIWKYRHYYRSVLPYQKDHLFPIGYMKFNDNEQYVLDNKLADITTYYEKMAGQFGTGVAYIDTG